MFYIKMLNPQSQIPLALSFLERAIPLSERGRLTYFRWYSDRYLPFEKSTESSRHVVYERRCRGDRVPPKLLAEAQGFVFDRSKSEDLF